MLCTNTSMAFRRVVCVIVSVTALALAQAVAAAAASQHGAEAPAAPSFKEVLSLRLVGNPVISADGRSIAYSLRATDWESNRFDREIWQNWAWFARYLWDEEVEIPIEIEAREEAGVGED